MRPIKNGQISNQIARLWSQELTQTQTCVRQTLCRSDLTFVSCVPLQNRTYWNQRHAACAICKAPNQ